MVTSRRFVRLTIVLYAVGFLTLLGIVNTSIWLNARARVYFDEIIEARETSACAGRLRLALQTADFRQRSYLVTGSETYLAPYDSAKAESLGQLDALKRLLAPHAEATVMLDRLPALVAEKLAEMDRSIALERDRRDDEAMALVRTNRGKALMDEANVFLFGIILNADERLSAGAIEQQRNASMLRWTSIIGAFVIIVVVAAVEANCCGPG